MARWRVLVTAGLVSIGCSAVAPPTQLPAPTTTAHPATPAPTNPAASDSPGEPAPGAIAHSSSPTDLVLRLGVYPVPAPPDGTLAVPPLFSLFGDGSVLYAQANEAIEHRPPIRHARINEQQVQELLTLALGPAALGEARATYDWPGVYDMPATMIEIHAGGVDKTVWVSALDVTQSDSGGPIPDAAARSGFRALKRGLGEFEQVVASGDAEDLGVFEPEWYELQLSRPTYREGGVAWPWPHLDPSDFDTLPDGTLSRVVSAFDAEKVLANWMSGYYRVAGPDDNEYVVVLRALQPDEAP